MSITEVANKFYSTTALVMNPINIDPSVTLPFELGTNVFLDRVSIEERVEFKEILLTNKSHELDDPYVRHEVEFTAIEDQPGSISYPSYYLEEEDWRYFVIRCGDNGESTHALGNICETSQAWIDIKGFTLASFGGYMHNPAIYLNRYGMGAVHLTTTITTENLLEIRELFSLYCLRTGLGSSNCSYPEIARAFAMLDSLTMIPKGSPFQVIGLFAIIEMLITHNPKLDDRGDSITHQMKSKIPLLARRFDRPLPYNEFFANVAPEKIWSQLYAYRSAIAHGGTVEFQTAKLKNLRDSDNANDFLRSTARALLRHVLREPDLYRDLKEC